MRRRFGSVCRRRRKDGSVLPGFWVRWTDAAGKRRMRRSGDTQAAAERDLDLLSGQVDAEVKEPRLPSGLSSRPLGALIPRIMAAWTSRLAKGSLPGREAALRRWSRRLGGRAVGFIRRHHVQGAVNLVAAHWRASSVHTDVRILRAAFNSLQGDLGLPIDNPCRQLALPKIQLRPRRHLPHSHVEGLINACEESARPAATLLAEAGLRPAELFRLTWREVALDLGVLRLEWTKTYQTRTVPLTPRARAALEVVRRDAGESPGASDIVIAIGERNFRGAFRKAAKAAGLEDLVPYDLRHAFANALLSEGVAPAVVRDLLGHANISTTDRYLRSLPGGAPQEAIETLARARGETAAPAAQSSSDSSHGPSAV